MMRATPGFAALTVLICSSCQTVASDEDQRARLIDPDEAVRAELQHAVNSAFGTDVLLADDALTESSTLTVENRQPATMDNQRPQGRVYDMPVQLVLVMRGEQCYLIDTRTERRFLLESATCAPE